MISLSYDDDQEVRERARRRVAEATGATDMAAQDRSIAQAVALAEHSLYSFEEALRCVLAPYYDALLQSQIATGGKMAPFANTSPIDLPRRDAVRWIEQHPARTPRERVGSGPRPGTARAKAQRRAARKAASRSRRAQHR